MRGDQLQPFSSPNLRRLLTPASSFPSARHLQGPQSRAWERGLRGCLVRGGQLQPLVPCPFREESDGTTFALFPEVRRRPHSPQCGFEPFSVPKSDALEHGSGTGCGSSRSSKSASNKPAALKHETHTAITPSHNI